MYWRSDGPEILRCVDPLMLSKKPDQIRPASSALFTQPVVIENIPPLHPSAAPSFTKVSSPSKRNQSASTASGNQKHRAKRSRLRQKGSQRDIITWPRKPSLVPSGTCPTSLEADRALDVLIKFFFEHGCNHRSDLVMLGRWKERVGRQVRGG